jgi:glycosyltransferase involved in cell wall biosynthesis
MRIGIDARLVYYTQAGIGQYITHLVNAFAQIDKQTQFVLLQSRKDRSAIVTQPNFRRVSLWTPCHHRLEQWTLQLEISPLDVDVLHSPDFIPPFRCNCKSVITVHDLAFLLYPHFLTRESARYYSQIDQAVRRTDHIIAVSEATKHDLVQRLGVPEGKVTVIYEASAPPYQPLPRDEARRYVQGKYGLDGEYILFVSTIEPRKNVPGLLEAYRQLLDSYRAKATLVLAGGHGWLSDEVFATVKRLDLESQVRFLGRVPTADLPYLYNAARLLVHPSFYEGFGLPPLEAMACGIPVVVSNVSALPEVVGDAGLLVDPNDTSELAVSMYRALTDESLRQEMIQKGFARAACFSWEKTARQTLEVYRMVSQKK